MKRSTFLLKPTVTCKSDVKEDAKRSVQRLTIKYNVSCEHYLTGYRQEKLRKKKDRSFDLLFKRFKKIFEQLFVRNSHKSRNSAIK